MSNNKYDAILFDLDGVICSTDEYHYLAWKTIADELGLPFSREKGNRTRVDLFVGSAHAKAYAMGQELPGYDGPLSLMTLSTDASTGAQVMVCGSTEFALESYLESAVFGNNDVLLSVMKQMGKERG